MSPYNRLWKLKVYPSRLGGSSRPSKHLILQTGFTLLEVTLSLAVLALALTALSTLQARNLTLTAEDKLLTEATLAGRDLLTRIQTGQIPLQDLEGDLGEDHPGWRWSLRLEDLGTEGLARMEMTLFKPEMPPERAVRFWLVVYKKPLP
ncbi:MAG: prepilin-type N-terminal cleavage/methylation domain-containing protein [Desulfobacterota bacterium U4-17]